MVTKNIWRTPAILVLVACQALALVRPLDLVPVAAIGSPELGYCLVTRDGAGCIRVVSRGARLPSGCKVLSIDAEQVRLSPEPGIERVVPVLHEKVSADVFAMGLATIYQRSVVVGAQLETLRTFSSDILTDPMKLTEFLQQEGLDLRVYDDCMIIRRGSFSKEMHKYEPVSSSSDCSVEFIRRPVDEVIEAIARRTRQPSPRPVGLTGSVSVKSFGISAEALLYYIGTAAAP